MSNVERRVAPRMTDRYSKQPFLRILEFYFLHVIGELPPAERAAMEKMAPDLGRMFQRTGSWTEIVERVMKIDPEFAEGIRQAWRDNRATHSAREFVVGLADKLIPR